MTDQKRQLVADLMDDITVTDAEVEFLSNDTEMRSIWSRFHLVRDIMQGEVPKSIETNFDQRVQSAIAKEPSILVPSTIEQSKNSKPANEPDHSNVTSIGIVANIKDWAEQAVGLAIAASVTAVIVFGVQTLNAPTSPEIGKSAITALELIEADKIQMTDQPNYSILQESLLDFTRESSKYGLKDLTPYVRNVNYNVQVPLTLIKLKYDSILDVDKNVDKNTEKMNSTKKDDLSEE